ncbi:hypothetical protein [Sutcliffiella halmapala]|uniref:hypothetical protein n=1 Tax=Sutcliffiella halmapala TaxID=79882 RepID=UPI000994FE8D|nr:hypothetical protein [Sutcliffiella halmapala]
MSEIDKRNRLGEEPFSYQATKKGTVLISYKGKQIMVVKEKDAERILGRLQAVEGNTIEEQLILAKITGNFKHGNERDGKLKKR